MGNLRKFRTAEGNVHVEAFCLMWYACPCGHRERFWNSRDGVTPFGTVCPSCGKPDLHHVDFFRDVYAPDHKLAVGQRAWIGMTRERAVEIADARIALTGSKLSPHEREVVIDDLFKEGSAPDMIVWGYIQEHAKQREGRD